MTNADAMSLIVGGPTVHQLRAAYARNATGPSAEAWLTGNSNPDFELFGGVAKGVK